MQQREGQHRHLGRLRREVGGRLRARWLLVAGSLVAAALPAAAQQLQQAPPPTVSLFPARPEPADSLAFLRDTNVFLPTTLAPAPPSVIAQPVPSPQPPLTPGGKFKLALRRTFYPGPLAVSAAGAGWSMLVDSNLDDGYGQGFDGFARRWGARVAFKGTKEVVGNFAIASALHQDPRYFPSPRKRVWRRAGYAVSRVFVTQVDGGGAEEFNYSNVGGLAAAAALSNTWYRDQDSGVAETFHRFGLGLALDAAVKLYREFITYRHAPRN